MAKKLMVGMVLDTSLDPPDGVQQYVTGIGEWLRSQGHDVHYLVGQSERHDVPNVHSLSKNISVKFNGNRTTIPLFANRKKIKQVLRKYRFDVLHVQTPHHPLMAQLLILNADRRTAVIGTFHIAPYGRIEAVGNRLLGWWLRPSLKRFDEIVSVSSTAATFAKQTFGINTAVLSNVIDYKLFHDAKPLNKYNDGVPTILFLGRLVPRKGCLLLLEAVKMIASQSDTPKFRVVICGKGPQVGKLQQFIDKNNLENIVEMVGFVSEAEKPRYYASADIAVFPSSAGESFGIVLLEAMASGQAVVLAGDNPGYHSVMEPMPGLLFDPHDAVALAQKISLYLKDGGQRTGVQKWGEDYAKGFDVKIVGQQLLEVYNKALRNHRQA